MTEHARTKPPAESAGDELSAPPWVAIARGAALFLGVFAWLNLLGELRQTDFDANPWWIDLRPAPPSAARAVLSLAALLLLAFAIYPRLPSPVRLLAAAVVLLLFGVALENTFAYYRLLTAGTIRSDSGFPLSLHIAACLAVVLCGLLRSGTMIGRGWRDGLLAAVAFSVCVVGFPLAQMHCYGRTDYRRPAQAVVVFGGRVNQDGTPSDALTDRVEAGCRLYRDGLVQYVILSAGRGSDGVRQTAAMTRLAEELGVPAAAIVADSDGVNTQATVDFAAKWVRQNGGGGLLAVSHDYHLPRIRSAFQRAGVRVFTVPAPERFTRPAKWRLVLREVAALWWHYLRPLAKESAVRSHYEKASARGASSPQ